MLDFVSDCSEMQFKRFRHIFYAVRFHCGTKMRTYVGRKTEVVAYGETLDELTKSPCVVEADYVVAGDLVTFEVEVPTGAKMGFFTVWVR